MHNPSSAPPEKLVFKTLRDQYLHFGLPVDDIDESTEFSIHNLKDIHDTLPYASLTYRPNFFSFVFVKDGAGKYTTDDLTFDTKPGTIYFTNPGHYKSYHWQQLEEVYLVTLSESFLK